MQDLQIEIRKAFSGPSLAKGDCGPTGTPAGKDGCVNVTGDPPGLKYEKKLPPTCC